MKGTEEWVLVFIYYLDGLYSFERNLLSMRLWFRPRVKGLPAPVGVAYQLRSGSLWAEGRSFLKIQRSVRRREHLERFLLLSVHLSRDVGWRGMGEPPCSPPISSRNPSSFWALLPFLFLRGMLQVHERSRRTFALTPRRPKGEIGSASAFCLSPMPLPFAGRELSVRVSGIRRKKSHSNSTLRA